MHGRTVLVLGATGNQGGATARRLLADGWRVRALTRDTSTDRSAELAERGAEVVEGHLDDRGSLDAALNGVHGVFSVQPGALGPFAATYDDEVRWGKNIADAATVAGVAHFVYSSVAGADRSTGVPSFHSKWLIEQHIHALAIPATILRPVSFMENFVIPPFGVGTGVLATPFALDIPEQLIALDDIAAFVALAFSDPSAWVGRTFTIAGDELTPPETAAALSVAAGREIPVLHIRPEDLQNETLATTASFLNKRGYGADIPGTRAMLPELMDFATWLDRHGAAALATLFQTAG